ncbi:MAG: hypothetical protein MJ252_04920 [archaeon]|nr:hypothetical protein [archaeon]
MNNTIIRQSKEKERKEYSPPSLTYTLTPMEPNIIKPLIINENKKEESLENNFPSLNTIYSSLNTLECFTNRNKEESKILGGIDFRRELQKKYKESKIEPKENIYDEPNIKTLLKEIQKLKLENQDLKKEIKELKKRNQDLEKHFLINENETNNFNTLNPNEYSFKKLNEKYKTLLNSDLNLFSFINNLNSNRNIEIKDNADYYIYNENEHSEMINNIKNILEDMKKYTEECEKKINSIVPPELNNSNRMNNEYNINNPNNNQNINNPNTNISIANPNYFNQNEENILQFSNNTNYTVPNKNMIDIILPKFTNSFSDSNINTLRNKSKSAERSKSKRKGSKSKDSRGASPMSNENIYDRYVKKMNDNSLSLDNYNYQPIYNGKKSQSYYEENCIACNLGCNISNSGYSAMTYSPYGDRRKRQDTTPIREYTY